MKKYIVFLALISNFIHSSYMNDQAISFRTILTGDCATSIDYNILNKGDGSIGGQIRLYGIHNMSVTVEGYEKIDLIKDDVCLYPYLFTILGSVLWNDNMFVQRWACVKWWMPLTFGFKINNNRLTILSSITKYKLLSPLRAKEVFDLIPTSTFDSCINDEDRNITVFVNGRSAVVQPRTSVAIYSLSSLHPWAVLARMLFL